jgi:thymidine phosphorylase
MVAACGGYVAKMSGRGLGHTGGTADKLQAIPNYQITVDVPRMRDVLRSCGCALISQSATLAPADKVFYGVRDVTATVDSLPLIVASILSKKLAINAHSFVADIKCGNGALMTTLPEARALANALEVIGHEAGLATHAIITDMSQVLGHSAGNAVEMLEVVDYLRGKKPDPRLAEVTESVGAAMLCTGGLAPSAAQAVERLRQAIDSGQAAERFNRMVHALGGPSDFIEKAEVYLGRAPFVTPVYAGRRGYVRSVKTRDLGMILVDLGAGRTKPEDTIDPLVGITQTISVGQEVTDQQPLLHVHHRQNLDESTIAAIQGCFIVGDEPPSSCPVIYPRI